MKIFAKRLPLLVLCLALLVSGALGCGGYKFQPLSGGPAATDPIEGENGGTVVKKGDYLFVVNGKYDSAEANDFGTPTKGNLYRVKLGSDGPIEETLLLSPKQVYSATATSGLFLSGDRIFYTSPSVEKNAKGEIFTSYLDVFSVKLNGADTKKLGYITSNAFTSRWVEVDGTVYFVYIDTTNACVTALSEDGVSATVAKDYVGTPLLGEDGYVYYTTSIDKDDEENLEKPEDEREQEAFYEVKRAKVSDGEEEVLIDKTNPIVAPSGINKSGTAITLSAVEDGVLYYTHKDRNQESALYAFHLTSKKEALISYGSPTVYQYLGFEEDQETYRGIIASLNGKVSLVKMTKSADGTYAYDTVNSPDLFGNNEVPTAVFEIDEESGYIYYNNATDTGLVRLKIMEDGVYKELHEQKEVVYGAAIDTSTLTPKRIGNFYYIVPTATAHPVYANYLYCWDLAHLAEDKDDNGDPYQAELVGKLTETDQETYDEAEEDAE